MRFLKLSISLIFGALLLNTANVLAASTENFYFDDFTADYYLSIDEEGISHLKVVENFTAVFPDYNQNKGMCRKIPFTNQGGVNVTLSELTRANIVVKRNGATEPIYSIEKNADNFGVCTGTEEYVTGRQIYTFEYEFERVVTDFVKYQELYWDTNGNGWFQKFNKVTARVHLVDGVKDMADGEKWCYVGSYGESGKDRCFIQELEDGWQFSAKDLDRYENLTFDIQLKPGSFVVPAPKKNYFLCVIVVIVVILSGLLLMLPYKKYKKESEKRKFYKDYFIKPEYQPHSEFNVAEMTAIYIGNDKKDSKIGVLLEMIVKKQITIIRSPEDKKQWIIKVEKLDEISKAGEILLKILHAGDELSNGMEIEVKKHKATSTLERIGRSYYTWIAKNIKEKNLATSKYSTYGNNNGGGVGSAIVSAVSMGFFSFAFAIMFTEEVEDVTTAGILVLKDSFPLIITIIVGLATFIASMLSSNTKQYAVRTMKGLEMSRYMDGLKMYIKMAEADRIKMLQSVEGADTSANGVVHLYEKLLPYAAVFGLEKSWLKEMEKYYQVVEAEDSVLRQNNLTMTDVLTISNLTNRYINQSVSYSSGSGSISGGGGFSSGFSGGGGGGFSGGGGGGGGGGGR
ncbi:DUF2207 domain-containing protein [Candidatus Saccharibacteria bacterium]|nr:DUF2207 domain-containing protein [Candidatus Saccharibacteria bacterium]